MHFLSVKGLMVPSVERLGRRRWPSRTRSDARAGVPGPVPVPVPVPAWPSARWPALGGCRDDTAPDARPAPGRRADWSFDRGHRRPSVAAPPPGFRSRRPGAGGDAGNRSVPPRSNSPPAHPDGDSAMRQSSRLPFARHKLRRPWSLAVHLDADRQLRRMHVHPQLNDHCRLDGGATLTILSTLVYSIRPTD